MVVTQNARPCQIFMPLVMSCWYVFKSQVTRVMIEKDHSMIVAEKDFMAFQQANNFVWPESVLGANGHIVHFCINGLQRRRNLIQN
jgi:hypothetical protein